MIRALRMSNPITRRAVLLAIGAALAGSLAVFSAHAEGDPIVVFAAASLRNALDEIDAAYEAEKGSKVIVSYSASSALAMQIEAGAPADVFVSADVAWMDYLAAKNLIEPETRENLVGNDLVLIAPADSALTVKIAPDFPLSAMLGGGRLAMANPDSVPAGKYGKTSLIALGVWDSVAGRIAPAADVRTALSFVARGEAPLGIVYRTDAAADPKVKILDVFPESSHPPIVYSIAVTAESARPDTAAYLAFLRSPAAAAAFKKQGFGIVK